MRRRGGYQVKLIVQTLDTFGSQASSTRLLNSSVEFLLVLQPAQEAAQYDIVLKFEISIDIYSHWRNGTRMSDVS